MADQVFSAGNVDFKEELLEWVESNAEDEGIDSLQAIEDMLEVVGFMARNAHRRDFAIQAIYAQAKHDARQELLDRIR